MERRGRDARDHELRVVHDERASGDVGRRAELLAPVSIADDGNGDCAWKPVLGAKHAADRCRNTDNGEVVRGHQLADRRLRLAAKPDADGLLIECGQVERRAAVPELEIVGVPRIRRAIGEDAHQTVRVAALHRPQQQRIRQAEDAGGGGDHRGEREDDQQRHAGPTTHRARRVTDVLDDGFQHLNLCPLPFDLRLQRPVTRHFDDIRARDLVVPRLVLRVLRGSRGRRCRSPQGKRCWPARARARRQS